MTDLREAAQQALESLEGWDNYGKWVWPESALEQAKRNTTESISALRAALAVPRLRANDNLSLADLGNEIHNASCTVVHLNEEIGARLGEIAVQLWYWKEQAAPVEHELNDRRCACCGYMTYHREHMGCIRAAAPKEGSDE